MSDKRKVLSAEEFKRRIINGQGDFRDLGPTTVCGDVTFPHGTVIKNVNLGELRFDGSLDLSKAQLDGAFETWKSIPPDDIRWPEKAHNVTVMIGAPESC